MPDVAVGVPTSHKNRRVPLGRALLGAPAAAIFILFFLLPLAGVVVQSLQDGTGFTLDNYARSLDPEQDIFLIVLARTAFIAGAVAVVCAVIGYAVAYAAVALPRSLGVALIAVVCLPFFSSALIRSYSWQVILGNRGPINELLLSLGVIDAPLTLVYNDIGVTIGMTQVLLPMMVFPLYTAMRGIDPRLISAARSMGSNRFRAWRTVFLPQSLPGLAAGFSLVFIVALGYYTTPSLLQGPSTPMFAMRIDTLASLPGNGGLLSAQSILVLIACIALLFVFRRQLGLVDGLARSALRPRGTHPTSTALESFTDTVSIATRAVGRGVDLSAGPLVVMLTTLLTVLAVAMSVGPIIVIAGASLGSGTFLQFPPKEVSFRWYQSIAEDSRWGDAFILSLTVSLVAAVIVALAAAAASFLIARSRSRIGATAGYALLVSPLVVPQVVLAIALLTTLLGVGLTGTPAALIGGYLIITLPMAVILLTTAFRSLDPAYEKASAASGASPLQTAQWVVLPLVSSAIISAILFSFVTAFSDLVIAQFLGGPNAQTLERLMFQDIKESVSPQVPAVGTLLLILIALIGAVALVAHRVITRRLRA